MNENKGSYMKTYVITKTIIRQTSIAFSSVAQLCPTLCDSMGYTVHGILPGQNTGVGILSLLQGIFPTQGFNLGLLHCRQILYQLSHWEAQEYWLLLLLLSRFSCV